MLGPRLVRGHRKGAMATGRVVGTTRCVGCKTLCGVSLGQMWCIYTHIELAPATLPLVPHISFAWRNEEEDR